MERTMAKSSPNRGMTKIQVFSLTAPEATSVMLVGDFTNWQKNPIPMHRDGKGIWQTMIALGSGTHRYRFLVDGEWRDDPECILRVQNPYGSEDSVRQGQELIGAAGGRRRTGGRFRLVPSVATTDVNNRWISFRQSVNNLMGPVNNFGLS